MNYIDTQYKDIFYNRLFHDPVNHNFKLSILKVNPICEILITGFDEKLKQFESSSNIFKLDDALFYLVNIDIIGHEYVFSFNIGGIVDSNKFRRINFDDIPYVETKSKKPDIISTVTDSAVEVIKKERHTIYNIALNIVKSLIFKKKIGN